MTDIITSLTLIFISASVVLFLFDRINHPSIPAYIIAGVFIGPLVSQENIINLAQVGVAFLVFVFGSSLELRRINNLIKGNVAITVAQTFSVGLFVFIISSLIGFNNLNSFYLALAGSLSSSLVGMELLGGPVSKLVYKRLTSSINLVQDIIAVMIFLVLTSQKPSISIVMMNVVLGITLMALGMVSKSLLPWLIEFLGRSREIYMLISVSVLLLFTSAANLFGLSIVIGSFAAGLALSKRPYNQEVLQTVGSLKDFFAAIFFVSLGALIKIPGLNVLLLSGFMVFVVSFVKPLFGIYSVQKNGYNKRTAYMTSLNLDQMSEFVLILAIQAFATQEIHEIVFQTIVLTATATMIISAYTSRYAEEIYNFIEEHKLFKITDKEFLDKSFPENVKDHFIIGGYDVQGREIARFLKNHGEETLIIDNDPEKIQEARADGMNYIYGDMMISKVWEEAKVEESEMVISTVPVQKISDKILSLETEAEKILRAKSYEEAVKYLDKCLYVIYPHYLSSKRLIEHLRGSLESEDYRKRLRKFSRRELDG